MQPVNGGSPAPFSGYAPGPFSMSAPLTMQQQLFYQQQLWHQQQQMMMWAAQQQQPQQQTDMTPMPRAPPRRYPSTSANNGQNSSGAGTPKRIGRSLSASGGTLRRRRSRRQVKWSPKTAAALGITDPDAIGGTDDDEADANTSTAAIRARSGSDTASDDATSSDSNSRPHTPRDQRVRPSSRATHLSSGSSEGILSRPTTPTLASYSTVQHPAYEAAGVRLYTYADPKRRPEPPLVPSPPKEEQAPRLERSGGSGNTFPTRQSSGITRAGSASSLMPVQEDASRAGITVPDEEPRDEQKHTQQKLESDKEDDEQQRAAKWFGIAKFLPKGVNKERTRDKHRRRSSQEKAQYPIPSDAADTSRPSSSSGRSDKYNSAPARVYSADYYAGYDLSLIQSAPTSPQVADQHRSSVPQQPTLSGSGNGVVDRERSYPPARRSGRLSSGRNTKEDGGTGPAKQPDTHQPPSAPTVDPYLNVGPYRAMALSATEYGAHTKAEAPSDPPSREPNSTLAVVAKEKAVVAKEKVAAFRALMAGKNMRTQPSQGIPQRAPPQPQPKKPAEYDALYKNFLRQRKDYAGLLGANDDGKERNGAAGAESEGWDDVTMFQLPGDRSKPRAMDESEFTSEMFMDAMRDFGGDRQPTTQHAPSGISAHADQPFQVPQPPTFRTTHPNTENVNYNPGATATASTDRTTDETDRGVGYTMDSLVDIINNAERQEREEVERRGKEEQLRKQRERANRPPSSLDYFAPQDIGAAATPRGAVATKSADADRSAHGIFSFHGLKKRVKVPSAASDHEDAPAASVPSLARRNNGTHYSALSLLNELPPRAPPPTTTSPPPDFAVASSITSGGENGDETASVVNVGSLYNSVETRSSSGGYDLFGEMDAQYQSMGRFAQTAPRAPTSAQTERKKWNRAPSPDDVDPWLGKLDSYFTSRADMKRDAAPHQTTLASAQRASRSSVSATSHSTQAAVSSTASKSKPKKETTALPSQLDNLPVLRDDIPTVETPVSLQTATYVAPPPRARAHPRAFSPVPSASFATSDRQGGTAAKPHRTADSAAKNSTMVPKSSDIHSHDNTTSSQRSQGLSLLATSNSQSSYANSRGSSGAIASAAPASAASKGLRPTEGTTEEPAYVVPSVMDSPLRTSRVSSRGDTSANTQSGSSNQRKP